MLILYFIKLKDKFFKFYIIQLEYREKIHKKKLKEADFYSKKKKKWRKKRF